MRHFEWLSVAVITLAVSSIVVPAVLPEILRVVLADPAAQPECPPQQDQVQQLKMIEL
ncbi:hypothetical protein J4729_07570 [Leisingera sp. HS039]|uniref:hypothetical protein n=1 Tax=Leisingera sp. HS039 TaxID=2818496 RepID=UPI001B3A7ADA|nr:hypothetical protein [Leisingera sp. HS039]MBQ4824408.1 hypothetical protein [Leisingera sp. HS039]